MNLPITASFRALTIKTQLKLHSKIKYKEKQDHITYIEFLFRKSSFIESSLSYNLLSTFKESFIVLIFISHQIVSVQV